MTTKSKGDKPLFVFFLLQRTDKTIPICLKLAPCFGDVLKSRYLLQSKIQQQHFHCSASATNQPACQTSFTSFYPFLPASSDAKSTINTILLYHYHPCDITGVWIVFSFPSDNISCLSISITILAFSLELVTPKAYIQPSKPLSFPWYSLSDLFVCVYLFSEQLSVFLYAMPSPSMHQHPLLCHPCT